MYLSDREILRLLPQIDFQTDNPDHPFDADAQIQPASVDIRLDNVFWKRASRKTIDLRRAKLLELSPRRHWRVQTLGEGESIALKPGEMLLGRTFERFTIPTICAAKIEGRSSFARMGLAVHCTGDFINPGWRGRMPLQLLNFSRGPIRIFPYLPICQVMLIYLSSKPARSYGERELSSKYMNDDGGPSYWWRDKRIKKLHRWLGEHDVAERVQQDVLKMIGSRDPDLIERFEHMVQKLAHGALTNADDLLTRFSRKEARARLRRQIQRGTAVGATPLLLAGTIASLFTKPFSLQHYALWAATLVAVPFSILGLRMQIGEYLGPTELDAARQAAQQGAAADEPQHAPIDPR